MIENPFPGPQPYRAADRDRFHGREDASRKLSGLILGGRCVTVYGSSGAGKSSLLQASVIPDLIDAHDVRVVRIDRWPEGQEPTRWLVTAMYDELGLGEPPPDLTPAEAILWAAKRVARSSSRLMLVYLDQMEQLLYPGRDAEESALFFESVSELVDLPLRSVRLVLSLREDYLGRFRDRLRDRRRILEQGFRVGPLTVAELTEAVCQAASGGEPPQSWSLDPMRALMLQVRVPGQTDSAEAEAQSAYAQIVCRALFQQRAQGEIAEDDRVEAEPILRRYLETTLSNLGPLRDAAQRLLEDHLVTADGSRTLRTENELLRILPRPELDPILRALEGEAILHAEEHQGSRYFEIGHDWLARKVFEERQAREQREALRRREEEHRRALAAARGQRRTLLAIAAVSLAIAAVTGALGFWAWTQKRSAEAARREAETQERLAKRRESEAHDAGILAGFRELRSAGKLALAMKLLPEVDLPAKRRGWVALASDALNENALRVTLTGHTGSLSAAAWTPDGKRVLTASSDRTARLWSADGTGEAEVLLGHEDAIRMAALSPDGERVLTASDDGTARVFRPGSAGKPVVLEGARGPITFAAWSPDGERVVTASQDGIARIYAADGSGSPLLLYGHAGPLTAALFHPDGKRIFTASEDKTVRLWQGDAGSKPRKLVEHAAKVLFLALSPDGEHLASTSLDGTARVSRTDGKGASVVLSGHLGAVYHAAWSSDGGRVATASGDRTARIFSADGKGDPIVLQGHTQAVTYVSFAPDSALVATASVDGTARIWSLDGTSSFVLRGHDAGLRSVTWSPDGSALVTAAGEGADGSSDRSAKVWSARPARSMRRPDHQSAAFFHNAFIDAEGKRVLAAYDDRAARLFRIDGAGPPIVFGGHDGWVTSAALSPRGDRVVTTSFDKTARVSRADGSGEPVVLAGHEAEVRLAVWSPDGERVLTTSDDRRARIFRADGKGEPLVLAGHADLLTSAAWSPDGERVVTTSLDHTARVFDADGQGEPTVLAWHKAGVIAAVFMPFGQQIVTASLDGFVRTWNLAAPAQFSSLPIDGGAVLRLAVRPDGDSIAVSSTDGTVRVWWPEKSRTITFDASAPVIALSFIDGGRQLLAVSADNTTHTWMIDVEALKERLFSAHADCLPPSMRVEYLREPAPEAASRYEACKKSPLTAPAYTKERRGKEADVDIDIEPLLRADMPPNPAEIPGRTERTLEELGPTARRVKVIVLPGDAEVALDGVPILRRDGVVELLGKLGETRKLRVQRGAQYAEQDVTITDGGASPALIDLMATIAAKAGAGKASTPKPGKDAFDPLTPDALE
jgi:WD40 repeat protein